MYVLFSQLCFKGTSSNLLSRRVLPKDGRIGFVQKVPPVLQLRPLVLDSSNLSLELSTCAPSVCADTASLLATCEDDALCSVNTALYPLSSLALSTRSTLPMYFRRCKMNRCKMNRSSVMFRLSSHFCLRFFYFLEVPGRQVSEACPILRLLRLRLLEFSSLL